MEANLNEEKQDWNFLMFYDGACPLCSREVRFLKSRTEKRNAKLVFLDTSTEWFNRSQYGLPESDKIIHGMLPNGKLVSGVEVFRRAYKEIGLGWLLAPTGWPVLRLIFDRLYLVFAKYRKSIGKCIGGSCERK
jgi:predicted DCC family thiol-disulfide oxidoreductase YuxK